MDYKLDINEMEKQRYEHIKKSGAYIELDILIGAKTDTFDGHTGKLPVINSYMNGCGKEEIGNMYIILKSMVEYYREQYPMECALAELTMSCNRMSEFPSDMKFDEGAQSDEN